MNTIREKIESFKLRFESFITGCDSVEEVELWDKEAFGEMDAFYYHDMASIIIRLIAIDGKITQKEVDYLNEAFDYKYDVESLTEVYENCKELIGVDFDDDFEDGIEMLRKVNAGLADAYKALVALACEIIIESDGVVDVELAEAKRIKALCE